MTLLTKLIIEMKEIPIAEKQLCVARVHLTPQGER
jgi:hypothetical protein